MTGPDPAPRDPPPPGAADDVSVLPGVHAARRRAFQRLGVDTVEDLLRLAPRRYEDRRHPTPVGGLVEGTTTLVVGVVEHARVIRARRGLGIHEAVVADDTGTIGVRWFYRGFLPRPLRPGARVALYGPVKRKGKHLELVSPAVERLPDPEDAPPEGLPGAGRLVPVHPLTTGLSAPLVRRAVWAALAASGTVEDPVPAPLLATLGLPPLQEALHDLHFPLELGDAERARRRLAFDELLVHEVLLAERRRLRTREPATPVRVDARVDERIRRRLPFRLTPDQDRVVAEIARDLEAPHPMNRLLQGDVGSGKTAVAAYALLAAVASGLQGAFMAPTEVLVAQHRATLQEILRGSRVRMETLVGSRRGKARLEALARIAEGGVDIVLGTHAVLSAGVSFARLGLAVVDEQHKFGVRQRHDLVLKAQGDSRPHLLVMTATPIPRTLALAVYGDLDVSVIEHRPPGRGPVETWVATPADGRRVFQRVQDEIRRGRQAFVVYPLVEESDKLGLKDATIGRERWARALPGVEVGLLHGRMKAKEKADVMAGFRRGEVGVLVATVVVEVGIDVPNATVLVVEHAERFGLSQLHQLRGRIGRGAAGGLCVLMDRASSGTPTRLEVLAATDDGFRIAEADLELRGTGDVFGTRQHGAAGFHAARLPRDLPLLEHARRAAQALLEGDPGLEDPGHTALQRRVAARRRAAEGTETGG